jgi:hypothetical protein
MPDLSLGGWITSITIILLIVLVWGVLIGLGLRLAGFGRKDPRNHLRDRLTRGEITQADFDTATTALGPRTGGARDGSPGDIARR